MAVPLLVGLLVFGAGAPARGATPTATASPSSGLVDEQVVTVTGSGFPPNQRVQIEECGGTKAKPPRDNTSCQGLTINGQAIADANGRFTNAASDTSGATHGFRVFVLPHAGFPQTPPACDAHNPCVLYVGVEVSDFNQPHVFVPLAFKGAPAGRGGSAWIWIVVAVVAAVVVAGLVIVMRRRSRPG
jgi:hypothetical protein